MSLNLKISTNRYSIPDADGAFLMWRRPSSILLSALYKRYSVNGKMNRDDLGIDFVCEMAELFITGWEGIVTSNEEDIETPVEFAPDKIGFLPGSVLNDFIALAMGETADMVGVKDDEEEEAPIPNS